MNIVRRALSTPAAEVVLIAGSCSLVYFLVFGWKFIFHDVGPGGDTQNVWSAYWIAIYSLRQFGELIWWDPTALNGWPAYHLTYHGWTTLLSPFQLVQLLFGAAINALSSLEITQFLVLQKTLFVVVINIVGITLIARELVTSTVARIFPPLVYALCQIQFLGYVAAATVEALPAVLYLLYALVAYNNRRTSGSLLSLLFFSGIYAVSVNYMTLTSHFYPLGFLCMFMLVLFPGILPSLWNNAKLLMRTRSGSAALLTSVLLVIVGTAVFAVGVRDNLATIARVVDGTSPFDINRTYAFDPPDYGMASSQIWTNLFYWIPYGDLHSYSMRFDSFASGHEYRYIGLATLPLIFVAIASGLRKRYTACLAGAFLMCILMAALTYKNLLFSHLIASSDIFKNIRTMAYVMPRDLASLLPVFVAAIGLDAVVTRLGSGGGLALRKITDVWLMSLIFLAGFCLMLIVVSPAHAPIRQSLGHVGVYLGIFCILLLLARHASRVQVARSLGWMLLLFVFLDLSTSASEQWNNNNGGGRYYHGKGPSTMKAEKSGIGPIVSEADSWPGTYYSGMVHNVHSGGPHFGLKYWLSLVTRPAWQPVVDTWNPVTRMVTQYPYFKFFTNGSFVPIEAIHDIDSVTPPAVELPPRILAESEGLSIRLDGRKYRVIPGDVGLVERAERSKAWPDRHSMTGWALDRAGGRPARLVLVFVGQELWYRGSPNEARPDLAQGAVGLLKSGFYFEMPGLSERATSGAASVRVFAVVDDARAIELRYANGYPFVRTGKLAVEPGSAATSTPSADRPTFYVHEPALVRSGGPGRRLYDAKWEVVEFTFNRVKVKVDLPEAAYMVFLDNYDRHWRSYVNGERTPVHRANFAFKTIHLPAGNSTVEWVYNPIRLKLAWATYYLLFVVAMVLCIRWARTRQPDPAN